ncbi:cilia- and flagella-associated protein 221-like [Tubulanus polymorphus]|uniref:cilia- and flagella-associated protein 221-like n=1 Tax=Tubulanus polymorphus TaxID=672921 RepID=UPI003DA240D1
MAAVKPVQPISAGFGSGNAGPLTNSFKIPMMKGEDEREDELLVLSSRSQKQTASTGRRSFDITTMQLIAPRKHGPELVPNHLLETKIYSKVAQNSVVQARPSVLHFEVGRTNNLELRLANVSTEVQRYHIIPPQTKYFNIKYTKNERLVPGLTLDCIVEFNPDEWRYYYDCIRIHCQGDDNLVIPIHAYPTMNMADFPRQLDFNSIPVGQSATRTVQLRSDNAPIEFEYQISILQPHPAFTVEPMAGTIRPYEAVDINVTFSPSEFSTSVMKMQVTTSQFNSKPMVCVVSGNSTPGLLKEISMQSYPELNETVLDPVNVSPIGRSRTKRKIKPSSQEASGFTKVMEKSGISFPVDLNTPYAVACVLNQEPGKLRAKDMREAIHTKRGSTASTRQMKEAMFEHAVRQDVYEERQNQLRWQVKVGDEGMTTNERTDVLETRKQAWSDYKYNRGDPLVDVELERVKTESSYRKTMRDASELAKEDTKFDMYSNDSWAVRYYALNRFAQVARKIVLRQRIDYKLSLLKPLVDECKNSKNPYVSPSRILQEKEDAEKGDEIDTVLSAEKVKSVTFPTYVPPNVKDDMAPDALDKIPVDPTIVDVKKKVPYFNLKVPQQYKLHGYHAFDVHEVASGYVPPNLAKPLRTGAEDEVINLPATMPSLLPVEFADETIEGDLRLEDLEGGAEEESLTALKPPESLFKSIKYPPLHIFNPEPGLQVYQPPLPYAETDPDYHLCPIPRYTCQNKDSPHSSTQKQFLDKDDVVKGLMTWKKFPSQGLTSLANTPTLTNVWMARWSNPFSSELLPDTVPALFDGLPEHDKTNIIEDDEDTEGKVMLTPQMVNAQFSLVDIDAETSTEKPKEDMFPFGNKMPATNIPVSATGPVPREKREQELDFFLNKKYDRLGQKIKSRIKHMSGLTVNKDLLLK